MRVVRVLTTACALLAVSPRTATPHELAETSATLVVRDGGHVELRMQIPWAEVLRRAWMPTIDVSAALVRLTAMPAGEFGQALTRLERVLEADIVLADDVHRSRFVRWRWPAPPQLQAALREELMSRVAAGAAFEHASRLPATAELTVPHETGAMRLRLPVALGPALLSVSRPTEQWLRPGERSAPIAISPRREH